MPVAQHPFEGSWGYHVTGYFAPMSKFGSPDEFRHLVDKLHQAGIGVIVDWVPGHFATDPWALQRFDGTALYEHEDPQTGLAPRLGLLHLQLRPQRGEELPDLQCLLLAGGVPHRRAPRRRRRLDALSGLLPRGGSVGAQQVRRQRESRSGRAAAARPTPTPTAASPAAIMVAEESTSWPGVTQGTDYGGLGFGFKWNMGWMNDSLRYMGREPIYRQFHHHEMTFAMAYAYSENFILPISHDEVVHGKGSMFERAPQDEWRKFGTLRAFYAFMWAHPGKKLLFMGTEFGQRREFSESRSIDWWQSAEWGHRGVQRLIKDLNQIYKEHPALWKRDTDASGFSWIDADDRGGNIFSWLRYDGDGQMIACITNFSSEPRPDHQIGLPSGGRLEGDLEHRRRGVRRHGLDRQSRQGRCSSRAVARLCGIRVRHHSAAWCGLAAARARAG